MKKLSVFQKVYSLVVPLALAFTFSIPVVGRADSKFGTVDMQKAVQTTNDGKKAKANLEEAFEKQKATLQAQEKALKKKSEEFEKKKSVMAEEALAKKQAELQEDMLKYRNDLTKGQVDMEKRQRELLEPILEKMHRIVRKVAQRKELSTVFEQNQNVIYSDAQADITAEVIQEYEKEK